MAALWGGRFLYEKISAPTGIGFRVGMVIADIACFEVEEEYKELAVFVYDNSAAVGNGIDLDATGKEIFVDIVEDVILNNRHCSTSEKDNPAPVHDGTGLCGISRERRSSAAKKRQCR